MLRDVNLVDGISLHDAGEHIRLTHEVEKAPLQYNKLHELLESCRSRSSWRPSQHSSIALSVDPKSTGQQRFLSAIQKTAFEPDPVDYRDLYPSLPPGKNPAEVDAKPIGSLASRLSFVLGRLSRHADPQILVVTHCYEMYWPLANIKLHHPNARVGIAYFSRLLDTRWHQQIRSSECPVEFFSLDEHVDELFGVHGRSTSSLWPGKEVSGLNQY